MEFCRYGEVGTLNVRLKKMMKTETMVPTWTGKMRKLFLVKEKSGNFQQTGKMREI